MSRMIKPKIKCTIMLIMRSCLILINFIWSMSTTYIGKWYLLFLSLLNDNYRSLKLRLFLKLLCFLLLFVPLFFSSVKCDDSLPANFLSRFLFNLAESLSGDPFVSDIIHPITGDTDIINTICKLFTKTPVSKWPSDSPGFNYCFKGFRSVIPWSSGYSHYFYNSLREFYDGPLFTGELQSYYRAIRYAGMEFGKPWGLTGLISEECVSNIAMTEFGSIGDFVGNEILDKAGRGLYRTRCEILRHFMEHRVLVGLPTIMHVRYRRRSSVVCCESGVIDLLV